MILIIEDEPDMRKLIRRTVETAGYKVIEASNAQEGMKLMLQNPSVVLLDLGLPDQDGQEFLISVREWSEIPIIVLSAREQEAEKVTALENGADDYLTKPFSAMELAARIKVALRHAVRAAKKSDPVYAVEGLTVDIAARLVTVDGVAVHLTPLEFKLLVAMIRHSGKVLTHGQLAKEVWGRRSNDGNQGLRIHTQHLREKLGDDPLSPRFIFTEPGIGYRFRTA